MARTKQTQATQLAPTPTPETTAPPAEVEETSAVKPKRTFRIVLDSIDPKPNPQDVDKLPKNGGKYCGHTPMQAAKKMFTQVARRFGPKNEACRYSFSIQEITNGTDGKTFSYVGQKTKRSEPQKIKKGDSEYEINFITDVKALSKKSGEVMAAAKAVSSVPAPSPSSKPTKTEKVEESVPTKTTAVANPITAKRPRTKAVKA
jgi:hypothetical protein